MAYIITNACVDVKDESCLEVCPVDCIYADEEDRMRFIEPDECIDCAVCVEACPVQAIFADDEVPAEGQPYIDINALYFKDKEAARAKVNELEGEGL